MRDGRCREAVRMGSLDTAGDRGRIRKCGGIARLALVIVCLGGLLAGPASQAQTANRPVQSPAHRSQVKRVQPKVHAGAVRVRTGKKVTSYHRTTQARPAEFAIRGPVRASVLVRNILPAAGGAAVRVRLELDGKPLKSMNLKAAASKSAALAAGGRIGALHRATVEIPAGTHTLRVVPVQASAMAAIRVLTGNAAPSRKIKWVAFAPQVYERPLILRSGDREETWYRFTADKPAGVTVHGPLRMKISTRLDFDQNAGTSQSYVVRVSVGTRSQGYSLKSRASQVANYPEMGEIVPGMAQSFTIKIPAGLHQVSFRLDGTTAAGATLRIRVPERELRAGNRS